MSLIHQNFQGAIHRVDQRRNIVLGIVGAKEARRVPLTPKAASSGWAQCCPARRAMPDSASSVTRSL